MSSWRDDARDAPGSRRLRMMFEMYFDDFAVVFFPGSHDEKSYGTPVNTATANARRRNV